MNRQIIKLFGLVVVLFAVLIGFTSYWSVFDAAALKGKPANKRPLFEQQQIKRGRILAADGSGDARSVAEGPRHGPALRAPLSRRRALRPPDRLQLRPAGRQLEFEQFHNDELVGNESEFSSILDQLRGAKQQG